MADINWADKVKELEQKVKDAAAAGIDGDELMALHEELADAKQKAGGDPAEALGEALSEKNKKPDPSIPEHDATDATDGKPKEPTAEDFAHLPKEKQAESLAKAKQKFLADAESARGAARSKMPQEAFKDFKSDEHFSGASNATGKVAHAAASLAANHGDKIPLVGGFVKGAGQWGQRSAHEPFLKSGAKMGTAAAAAAAGLIAAKAIHGALSEDEEQIDPRTGRPVRK